MGKDMEMHTHFKTGMVARVDMDICTAVYVNACICMHVHVHVIVYVYIHVYVSSPPRRQEYAG